MNQKRFAIFDFFGTLAGATSPENSAISFFNLDKSIHPQVQRAFCGANFKGGNLQGFLQDYLYIKSDKHWREYLGNCCLSLGIDSSEQNAKTIYEIIYSELINKCLQWLPDRRNETLEELSKAGFELAIASNAYPPTKDMILNCTTLPNYIKQENMFMSYEMEKIKADLDYYLSILKELGVSPENVMMIGDSWKSDVQAFKNATEGAGGGILCNFKQDKSDTDGNVNGKINVDNPKNYEFSIVKTFSEIPEAVERCFSEK